MKYVKMLGLAAVAALAMTALLGASTASATVLCKVTVSKICPTNEDYPAATELHASVEAGNYVDLKDTEGNVLKTCTGSTFKAKTQNTGGVLGVPVEAKIESLTFTGCSSSAAVLKNGEFDIEYFGGSNTRGTLTLKETQITTTVFGSLSCTYGAAGVVDAGVITGTTAGAPAMIHFSALLPKEGGGFLCLPEVVWQTVYSFTTPKPLYIKQEMD